MKYEIDQYARLLQRTDDFLELMEKYSISDREIIEKAYHFACHAHRNQIRKATAEPYVIHCIDVACYLMEDDATAETVAAGLLHDTVEDIDKTAISEYILRQNFPKIISDMVMDMTEKDKSLPWSVRKGNALEHVQHCNYETKHVKCADKLSNIRSMIETNESVGSSMWKYFKGGLQGHKNNFQKLHVALEDVAETKTYMEFSGELEKFMKI